MSRLLIVSNRLPVTVKLERGEVAITQSAGGLVTGLRSFHDQSESLWIGWPGDVSRFEAAQRAQIEKNLSELRTVPVHLTQAEITRHYEGFSNGVIWPLFHYLTDKVQRDAWRNWKVYAAVNQRFAEAVAEHYRPGDLVWIHDYQLALVPRFLRRLIPDARIGFFLHIPFPSSEVFRILPWRNEILQGMLGADIIGFHTYSYLTHFTRALLHVLRLEAEGARLQYGDREVRLGVFPMGIDSAAFSRLANDEGVVAELASIKKKSRGRKLLVGVDRLDYTKGLTRRMLAIERLFEREPSLRNKIRLVQVVVPSRTRVEPYEQLRRQLDEVAGRQRRLRIGQRGSNSLFVPLHKPGGSCGSLPSCGRHACDAVARRNEPGCQGIRRLSRRRRRSVGFERVRGRGRGVGRSRPREPLRSGPCGFRDQESSEYA